MGSPGGGAEGSDEDAPESSVTKAVAKAARAAAESSGEGDEGTSGTSEITVQRWFTEVRVYGNGCMWASSYVFICSLDIYFLGME